jgi:hypothetical protein
MAAMKTTGVCLCDSPLRFEHGYCGRCWNRQFAPVEHAAATPFDGAAPGTTAGEATTSPADPLADDDYTEAFGNTDRTGVAAMSACDPQPGVDHCRCWWQAEEACCWCGNDGDDFVACTPIATVDGAHGKPGPPPAYAPPVPTAGEGRPSTLAPADLSPWDSDPIEAEAFVPALSDTELDRIAALVAKHTSQ